MNKTLNLLTISQLRALYWLAHGRTVKEIAVQMSRTRKTITTHLYGARFKLGASTRAEAVAIAVMAGIYDIDIKALDN